MVGLVVVSHSPALADAAVALAMEMVQDNPPRIATAAGVAGETFGTDAVAVGAAIEEVDDGDGVVVLMDLGSAVISSEIALDFIDPELRERVYLTAAPLVEGLVAAVVQAAAGEPAEVIVNEAVAGLGGKQAHLGIAPEPIDIEPGVAGSDADTQSATFTVTMPHGLHARPAAKLVAVAKRFDATVHIRNVTTGSDLAPAASLSRVAAIGARHQHEVEVVAAGRQAADAVSDIVALASRNFDEDLVAAPLPSRPPATGGPLPAAPGIGIGPKWSIGARDIEVPAPAGQVDADAEWRTLEGAIAATRQEITETRNRLASGAESENAAIFDAHAMLLDDEEIGSAVREAVLAGESAAVAWKRTLQNVEATWAGLDDPYLNARAADVRAVCNQLLRHLVGGVDEIASQPGILVANELTPADVAQLDVGIVAGIVTAHGSPTSHTAILARALGLPAVVAAGESVLDIEDGTEMVIDGSDGTVLVNPTRDLAAEYRHKVTERAAAEEAALARAHDPATTSDGITIEVAANTGSPADVDTVAASGADAVGLLRTEFFFIDRDEAPSAEEQEAEYRRLAEAVGGRRLTIRTLDVGGDKPIGYLAVPHEDNPFLGTRGIRLSRRYPELLQDQLSAIVRVAHDHPVSVMFPMITAVAEIDWALNMLDTVCTAVGGRPEELEVGMMIEVPGVAANAAAFTPKVDFVSIGTNDLTQYTLATERGNENVAHLSDALDPGVLRLIRSVTDAAGGETKVGVCGELASDLVAVPVLVGLGVDELSVNRFSLPAVKDEVRRWSMADAASLATEALGLGSGAAVRELVSLRVR